MNIIHWVHIIDNKGSTFFSLENQVQQSENTTSTLMSRLIFSLQTIAKDLEINEIQSIEMGSNRFFLCKEQNNYLFILKTNRDADAQVITQILQEIIDKYHEIFEGDDELISIDEKLRRLNSLSENVKQLINGKSDC